MSGPRHRKLPEERGRQGKGRRALECGVYFLSIFQALGSIGLIVFVVLEGHRHDFTFIGGLCAGSLLFIPALLGIIGSCCGYRSMLLYYYLSSVLSLTVVVAAFLIGFAELSVGCDFNYADWRHCDKLPCIATNTCTAKDLQGTGCKAFPKEICDQDKTILAVGTAILVVYSMIQVLASYCALAL
eukprot:EC795412.1.p1 GENE.EC795412.1~~EC795412.1.p1  ORF type:complete len:185 (+),score=38.88 EC795412.1:51-605(+)